MSGAGPADLVEVRILGLPLPLYQEAAEHHDELRREFEMIVRAEGAADQVPGRLLDLLQELGDRFSNFSDRPAAALSEALQRGDDTVDVTYQVPPTVRRACRDLDQILDEADRYCREGDHLLALATPPAALAFRRWFLAEFVAQVDGEPPTPWPESPLFVTTG